MMSARLLKLHVVLMESINSMLGNLSRSSRNISLELLSARVCVKKRLGFIREAAIQGNDAPDNSDEQALMNQVGAKKRSQIKPHMTIISALSMKQVRPHALQAMQELKHFAADAFQITQNMFRFATPDPLQEVPSNEFQFLNESDRPFATLPPEEKRLHTIAQKFHRQWFQYKKENFTGKASLLCFFLADQCPPMFDPRKAFRLYYVGEIVHSQASCCIEITEEMFCAYGL